MKFNILSHILSFLRNKKRQKRAKRCKSTYYQKKIKTIDWETIAIIEKQTNNRQSG